MQKTEQDGSAPRRDFWLRIVSSLVLAPLAIAVAYAGGWLFAAFWLLATLAVWWEWVGIVDPKAGRWIFVAGCAVLALEAWLAGNDRTMLAVLVAIAAAMVLAVASRMPLWIGGGVLYASVLIVGAIAIRNRPDLGFAAIILLFAVVWATDILGYFVGRTVGGPKLAPSISPGKTWSGALGGTLGAMAAVIAIAAATSSIALLPAAIMALLLSVAAQAGDLFESKIKRVFNVKDSGSLIPGHGGVMDRLDGFIAAAGFLALFAALRAAVNASGRGFVLW